MIKLNSIKAKLSIVMLLIMIISLCTLGGINYWNARKVVLNDAESNLQTLAANYSEKLGFWVEKRKAEVSLLANSPILLEGNKETIIQYLQSESKRNPAYSRFLIADLSGNTYYSNGATANIGDRDYFQQSKAGKTVISDPVVSKVDGKLVAVISTPVMKNGSVVAVLGGTVTMDEVATMITNIKIGNSGYAYLKQKDGLTIAHPDPNAVLKNNPLTDASMDPTLKALTEKMVRGENGLATYNYKGEAKYVAYAPVPETTWSLAVNAPVQEVTDKVVSLMWISIFVVLFYLVIVAGIIQLFAKRIAAPIQVLNEFAQQIAQGDLTKTELAIHSDDEIGALGKSFRAMAENLRTLIGKVSGSAQQVSLSAQDLTTSSEQSAQAVNQVAISITDVAQGAERQLQAVDKASVAVQKMSTGIAQVAGQAENVAEEALQTSNMAREGSTSVDKAVNQMSKIEQIVTELAHVIDKLGNNSKEIGQIVDTIAGIAGQTNLLALNAAIEAARAGEQGRGFAVVAEEVRKLAEQSQESAKQIADLIGEIQQDTDKAVSAMSKGTGEVRIGAEVVGVAGQAFQQIAAQIEHSSVQANAISKTIQEMAGGSQQIVDSVQEIDDLSKQAAGRAQTVSAATEEQSAFMEEIAASSQKLVSMSQELENAVRKFHV